MNETLIRQRSLLLTVTWLWVGIPFGYSVVELVETVVPLFTG